LLTRIRSWCIGHRPSDWFHFRPARGAFRRSLFQRGNRLVARRHLSLCRFSPRGCGVAPHALQARPSDQQRNNTRQHRKAAKGRADER
jgi:hypothetical protein